MLTSRQAIGISHRKCSLGSRRQKRDCLLPRGGETSVGLVLLGTAGPRDGWARGGADGLDAGAFRGVHGENFRSASNGPSVLIAATGAQPHSLPDAHCHKGTSLGALALPSGSPRLPEALPLATHCVFQWVLVHGWCVRSAAAPVQWLFNCRLVGNFCSTMPLSRGSPRCTCTAIQRAPVWGSPHFPSRTHCV